MSTIVDTNVLLDVMNPGSEHHDWSVERLIDAKGHGPVIVSDIVYCEFAIAFTERQDVDEAIGRLDLERRGHDDATLYRAAKAFRAYRQNGGPRENLLPDFLIGALAEIDDCAVLTRDPRRIKTYYPNVELITP